MEFTEYFKGLKKQQKIKFFQLINQQCGVRDSTIYSWINKKRDPKPVYKAILSRITGIEAEILFPEQPENELPKF